MALRNAPASRVLLAILGVAFVLSPLPAAAINVGEEAPDFTLIDVDGFPHSLSGYTEHPVLLFFVECDAAVAIGLAPQIETGFHQRFGSRGLYVLAIDAAGCRQDQLEQFRNVTGITYPLLANGGIVQDAYNESTGTLVLVDGEGIVRFVARQYDEPSLRDAVEATLREANSVKEETWGLIKNLYGR